MKRIASESGDMHPNWCWSYDEGSSGNNELIVYKNKKNNRRYLVVVYTAYLNLSLVLAGLYS